MYSDNNNIRLFTATDKPQYDYMIGVQKNKLYKSIHDLLKKGALLSA